MNIRAGLGEYILQIHDTKFFEDSMGEFEPPNSPLGKPVLASDLSRNPAKATQLEHFGRARRLPRQVRHVTRWSVVRVGRPRRRRWQGRFQLVGVEFSAAVGRNERYDLRAREYTRKLVYNVRKKNTTNKPLFLDIHILCFFCCWVNQLFILFCTMPAYASLTAWTFFIYNKLRTWLLSNASCNFTTWMQCFRLQFVCLHARACVVCYGSFTAKDDILKIGGGAAAFIAPLLEFTSGRRKFTHKPRGPSQGSSSPLSERGLAS